MKFRNKPSEYIYSHADWSLYRRTIDYGIRFFNRGCFNTPKDIEFVILKLVNQIQFARQKSIPIYQRNYKPNHRPAASRGDRYWRNVLSDLSNGVVTRSNIEKRLENCSNSPIDHISNDRDRIIANQFADTFKRAHNTTLGWTHPSDNEVRKHLYSSERRQGERFSSFYFKSQDTKNVIESLKPKKSSGPDGIQNILLINLPQSAIELLTEIFNACVALSYWPTYFKVAKIIPILKPDKDPTDTTSYRPISITNSIGKIFELLVKEEIEKFVVENKIIPPQQFGFRKFHSPMMQIKRIMYFMGQSKMSRKTVGLVKLDIEKASDSVWHDRLIYKLKEKFNFPQSL